ncbi:putative FAD dependent oxidoreductase [Pseudomassariella vexata]|uniref:Putative FAD dependent oxidoreductase n=1 Tax=Pseudomassariella vexata TaxID=1141098 RepID=A0A1Y2DNH9_9PEZI|nr:putative FAD dependent oxidoreductase [Pseudomassariella vexata]ORY60729.1 putative FAD dependent oxidoreductase [Pseudomassariella vexata]
MGLSSLLNLRKHSSDDIISRDVAVIGGGASGVYTAFRLRDNDQSVIVIEKKDRLGGHAEVYSDPNTGSKFNMGVQVFEDSPIVRDYFRRFNVPLVAQNISQRSARVVDFSTGEAVQNYTRPNSTEISSAFVRYARHLSDFPGLRDGFNVTYPVPPDLLLPFGQFIDKYELGSFVETVMILLPGFTPLLELPTLYVFKALSPQLVQAFQTGFVMTPDDNTARLYDAAAQQLGCDVLYNTTILAMDRSSSYSSSDSNNAIKIAVQTPKGVKLILAKQLVSAIPPTPQTMQGYDLSAEELLLFNQFSGSGYYTAVLNNTGLTQRYQNFNPMQPYGVPLDPLAYSFEPAPLPGYTKVFYASAQPMSEEEVKANIIDHIARIKSRNPSLPLTEAEFVAFSDHSPFNLMVGNEAVRDGFYERMYGLQEQRGTWFAGAAWMTQDSAVIWEWVEEWLLPRILEAAAGGKSGG